MGSCACINSRKIKVNLLYAKTKSQNSVIENKDDQAKSNKKYVEENIIIVIPYTNSQKSLDLDISYGEEISSKELSGLFPIFN